ncbi:uncharacterized protein J7T54_003380 [Emericellopsis cladophorae]|uniref:Uncharacterized protein n=1 Tax=Emericellopsis cladophorae TaxID=2686198 RepID=A0A9P9XVJ0_9HYPO|nr:uncharacterized protein J7T54_003380 [Emericellopsis cladophorae]KAI6778601.1 hypothetical protein J7T54_003380 [Emericellopsis cladophorae]
MPSSSGRSSRRSGNSVRQPKLCANVLQPKLQGHVLSPKLVLQGLILQGLVGQREWIEDGPMREIPSSSDPGVHGDEIVPFVATDYDTESVRSSGTDESWNVFKYWRRKAAASLAWNRRDGIV